MVKKILLLSGVVLCMTLADECYCMNNNPNPMTKGNFVGDKVCGKIGSCICSAIGSTAGPVGSIVGGVAGNKIGSSRSQTSSDYAWDRMQFYEMHGMHQEAMDHDLQMRHSGKKCNLI